MARIDLVGALCTLIVIGLVAWLSLESWKNADCRELLRTNDFARAGEAGPSVTAELSEFRAQLEAGKVSAEAESCVSRVGLPF